MFGFETKNNMYEMTSVLTQENPECQVLRLRVCKMLLNIDDPNKDFEGKGS